MSASTSSEFVRAMGPVARELLGEPSEDNKTKRELRFGTRGSLSVSLDKGTWHDHEQGKGGGVLDLVQDRKRLDRDGAIVWLQERGHITKADARKPGMGRQVAWYDYLSASGELVFQVVRFEPKDFRQRRQNGNGGWHWKMAGVQLVLYRLPEIVRAIGEKRTVYIAEGEKGVHALGIARTGRDVLPWRCRKVEATLQLNPRGRRCCGAAGFRSAGHDEGWDVALASGRPAGAARPRSRGRRGAEPVRVAGRVRVVMLPGLPIKGDCADWISAGGTREALEALLPTSEPEVEPAISERSEPDEPPPDIADPGSHSKATIRVVAGKIDVLTDDAEDALLAAQAEVFQRAGHVVRPGSARVDGGRRPHNDRRRAACAEAIRVDRGTGPRRRMAEIRRSPEGLEADGSTAIGSRYLTRACWPMAAAIRSGDYHLSDAWAGWFDPVCPRL